MVVTCEHGGYRVPAAYRSLFRGRGALLASHRGWDPGALELARRFGAPLHFSTTTRLLVELNRSPGHPRLFSEFTRGLDAAAKARLLARHYLPYRAAVESAVRARRSVLHLSSHSFAPVLEGEVRRMDVGLLYDPARRGEAGFCARWRAELLRLRPDLIVARNAPYRGTADGLVTHLRRVFPESRYLGIELEVNQKHVEGAGAAWRELPRALVDSFRAAAL
ncbi:MAG: N-formylglutamate amidohydrolase [Planctomycetaceae bacterium]